MKINKNLQRIGTLYKLNLENATTSLSLDKKAKKISINKDNTTQAVKYNLSNKTSTFKTTLTFKSSMNEKQCKQEFNKINNLKLMYATIANISKSNIKKSISYFENALSKSFSTDSKSFSTPINYAKEMFKTDLNLKDNLFTLTTKTTKKTKDKYTVEATLSVNNTAILATSNSTSSTNSNSSNKKGINSNSKLPQTGHFINIKHILIFTIFLAIIAIVYLKTKGTNNEQKR